MKNSNLFSFFLLSTAGMSGCHSKADNASIAAPAPIPVAAQPVLPVFERRQVAVSGALEANKTVTLGFLISGRVQQVNVAEGDQVRAGQLLASLEVGSYQFALNAAQATLARAKDEYSRLKFMYDRGSLTPSDLEAAKTAVTQAQAQFDQARKNVHDSQLVAPLSGQVVRRGVEAGESVGSGTPAFTIVSGGRIMVRAAVPEAEVSALRPGLTASVRVPALDTTFTGRIESVGPVADAASRTYAVKMVLPNPDGQLRPGMIAEATITTPKQTQVLSVPGEAIVRDPDQLTYVFVVDSTHQRAFRRRVEVGGVTDTGVRITNGLRAGELLVVSGQQRLRDGATIHSTTSRQ